MKPKRLAWQDGASFVKAHSKIKKGIDPMKNTFLQDITGLIRETQTIKSCLCPPNNICQIKQNRENYIDTCNIQDKMPLGTDINEKICSECIWFKKK